VGADVNAGKEGFEDSNGDFLQVTFGSIGASAAAFFSALFPPDDTDIPTVSPSAAPTTTANPTHPTTSPTQTPSTEGPSATLTVSRLPSNNPTVSAHPTVGEETLNRVITCISVIDEAYEHSNQVFIKSWAKFRERFPDRPFCLLQPANFFDSDDEEDILDFYPGGLAQSDLHIPDSFLNDKLATYARVNRDMGDKENLSDWYELCDLDGLREEGIARVAFFIDQSGSLETKTVRKSYNLFLDKVDEGGVEIVAGIYNAKEYWIKPFLTDFGYGDNTDDCPPSNLMAKLKARLSMGIISEDAVGDGSI